MVKKIVVSGGFDPIHIGHVRMILEASHEGDVIVIANSDEWLQRKKGYVFMPWEERAEIIRSIRGVAIRYCKAKRPASCHLHPRQGEAARKLALERVRRTGPRR